MQEKNSVTKIALVYGNLPTVEEIDQFQLLAKENFEINVVTSESICGYLTQMSKFQDLKCIALPDYDENPSYLPGLEKTLADFDVVIVKERIGLYAFQAVKSKLKHKFRLICWVDNATPFPGEDVTQMRTIREEVTNGADAFIVQSELTKAALITEGVEADRIKNMTPWVEAEVSRSKKLKTETADDLGITSEDFVIAHLGQVEWEEGLFTLAHAVAQAVETDAAMKRRLKLLISGIGSLSPELRDRLIALGIDDRVVYLAPNRTATETVLKVADLIFYGPIESRDRFEADPYRLVMAMANGVPVLASRNAMVEEYIGKHRVDFCPNSSSSLADAIVKSSTAQALLDNIVTKNADTYRKKFTKDKVTKVMTTLITRLTKQTPQIDVSSIDHQVFEVESKVKTKQYLEAIEMIESIFTIQDLAEHHKANLYRLIGDCFTKLGDLEAGKDAYIKSIDLDKYSAKAYIGLGTVGLTKGSNDIAVIHFQKAVGLAPDDEMANLGLGLAFQGLNELEEASRWIKRSLEINPINTVAIFSLVNVCNETGDFAITIEALRKYLAVHPNDNNMTYTLAGILFKTGAYPEVLEKMEGLLKLDPMDARAQTLINQTKRAMEQTANASTSNG